MYNKKVILSLPLQYFIQLEVLFENISTIVDVGTQSDMVIRKTVALVGSLSW